MEYLTLRTIVKYIGLSERQFCELPKDPDTCKLLFELEDLVFRLLNAEQFEKRAQEQDQMLKEREEFKKKIL